MAAMLSRLTRSGVLRADRDFSHDVFRVQSVETTGTAEDVACLIDPFCYVSYDSALRLHGLRGGPPGSLHLSTPEAAQWRLRRAEQLQPLTADNDDPTPSYPRIYFHDKLRRRSLILHTTAADTQISKIHEVRTSTIGATFADTLAEPRLCGGMAKVLGIWRRHARDHVSEIVAALDRSATKIVKVRAGYIFTERLGVETPEISAWRALAQRGGSRRLDPERPYAPIYSERWMLSLNV